MQLSNIAARIYTAFANTGTKNTIPVASQIGITPGAASYTDGFPPLTLTPVASGGIPPYGADFNGILNAITTIQKWQSGGGLFQYDATWSSTNGGYPQGALLLKATGAGFWQNLTDNNTTNPDTGGAGWVDYVGQSASIVGAVRNLVMNVTAASATATLTADEIAVETALGGTVIRLASFNKSINLGTTGAGGMDTGTAPVSGYVALYAIYNPATGASALLATNATSARAANIYGGANMPAGYTASALVSVWPTNASSQFVVAVQRDRTVFTAQKNVYSSTSIATTPTALSIASAVPLNAISAYGAGGLGSATVAGVYAIYTQSDASGTGLSQITGYVAAGAAIGGYFKVMLTTAQTIYYNGSAATGATFSLNMTGYDF